MSQRSGRSWGLKQEQVPARVWAGAGAGLESVEVGTGPSAAAG